MDWVPVESTSLNAVKYEAESLNLFIEFEHGAIYRYSTVPQAIFDGMLAAESKGQFFNANIRNVYPYVRIS